MTLILITIGLFAIIMAMMAVGVIFSGKCLRGSCGGSDVIGPDGEPIRCSSCPKRQEDAQRIEAARRGTIEPVAVTPRYEEK